MSVIKAVYDFNTNRLNLSDKINKFQDIFFSLNKNTPGYDEIKRGLSEVAQAMVELHGSSNDLIREFDKYIENEYEI